MLLLFQWPITCQVRHSVSHFFKALINTAFFMAPEKYLGLGTFLSNFANLTAGNRQWSSFSLEKEIISDRFIQYEYCKKMSVTEKFLHEYFKDLSTALGFSKNHSLSLLEIPSMLSSAFTTPSIMRRSLLLICKSNNL